MTEKFKIEVKTEAGQNVLEYHDLKPTQLERKLTKLVDMITAAEWTYIDIDIQTEGENRE